MINLIFSAVLAFSPVGDSLRTETINGKVFIIHRVGEKETLYGVSRRYGTPITDILEYNPKAASGLEVGQLLQILYVPKSRPSATAGVHTVATKETLFSISRMYNVSVDELKLWNNLKDNNLSLGQELIVKKPAGAKEVAKVTEPTAVAGTHKVEDKETLFSISKRYGATVQQLKEWNNLTTTDVRAGQVLIVVPAGAAATLTQVDPKKEVVSSAVVPVTQTAATAAITTPETKTVVPVITDTKPPDATIKISENVRGSDEVKEGGLAELIEGTDGNRKYLALHRTAHVGAIIKVRNELNNREVFVRVVGPLPDTGVNDRLVVKLSKSAYDRLGAIDPRFRVEVTYYK